MKVGGKNASLIQLMRDIWFLDSMYLDMVICRCSFFTSLRAEKKDK